MHALKELFSRFGVPEKIVSDNGTQSTGNEFRKICRLFAVEHATILLNIEWTSREACTYI